MVYPLKTLRKLNIDKTFRKRPGRLLNVLCMFNLRAVSREYILRHLSIFLVDFDVGFLQLRVAFGWFSKSSAVD